MYALLLLLFLTGQKVLQGANGQRSILAPNAISTAFAYQGSHSMSKPSRLIVTSTNVDNDVYASHNRADFSNYFLVSLWQDMDVSYSLTFPLSSEVTAAISPPPIHHPKLEWSLCPK